MADTVSIIESDDTNSDTDIKRVKDIIEDEPLYYVLGQFFESQNGKNISSILEDIVKELKDIKITLQKKNNIIE